MEYWKAKKIQLKHKASCRSNINAVVCKKHPKHKQSPGVCSICLNEKLSQLSNTTTTSLRPKSSSLSSSFSDLSPLSSSNGSSYSSPVLSHSMRVFSHNMLNKSRSVPFLLQRRKEDDGKTNIVHNNGLKRGFWSKLLRGDNKRLMHSRTTREKVPGYH